MNTQKAGSPWAQAFDLRHENCPEKLPVAPGSAAGTGQRCQRTLQEEHMLRPSIWPFSSLLPSSSFSPFSPSACFVCKEVVVGILHPEVAGSDSQGLCGFGPELGGKSLGRACRGWSLGFCYLPFCPPAFHQRSPEGASRAWSIGHQALPGMKRFGLIKPRWSGSTWRWGPGLQGLPGEGC